MARRPMRVLALGNAIVDILAHADDDVIDAHALNRGGMTLIDAQTADRLYKIMGPAVEVSGGSAANTAAGVASFGAAAGFVGKVRDDQFGAIFRHDIRAAGVRFDSRPAADGPPTARCMILVAPGGERCMHTYLGACVDLGPEDIDPNAVAAAEITYMEGYLWDKPRAKQAFVKAAKLAHQAGRKTSLTLSDAYCVDRHRDSFRDLVDNHVDVLFANEREIMSLYQVDAFDDALAAVRGRCDIAALTRSEKGCVVVANGRVAELAAEPVDQVVDTTGAGDLYAAGFLYGLTNGYILEDCARLGGLAAAEIIGHIGARPETSLADLAAAALI